MKVTDPTALTPIPERTQAELEEFAVFAICVAGKTARVVRRQLQEFWDTRFLEYWQERTGGDLLRSIPDDEWEAKQPWPFQLLKRLTMEEIQQGLKAAGIGCHTVSESLSEWPNRSRYVHARRTRNYPWSWAEDEQVFRHVHPTGRAGCCSRHAHPPLAQRAGCRRSSPVPLGTSVSRAGRGVHQTSPFGQVDR